MTGEGQPREPVDPAFVDPASMETQQPMRSPLREPRAPAPPVPAEPPPRVGAVALALVGLVTLVAAAVLGLDLAGLGTRARRTLDKLRGAPPASERPATPPPATAAPPPASESPAPGATPAPAPATEPTPAPAAPATEPAPPATEHRPATEPTPAPPAGLDVTVTTPVDGAVLLGDELEVFGQVRRSGTGLEVDVAGVRATVQADGTFFAPIHVKVGFQRLVIEARNAAGAIGAAVRDVVVVPPPRRGARETATAPSTREAGRPLPAGYSPHVSVAGEGWFMVDVPAGRRLRVVAAFVHDAGDLSLELQDEAGRRLAASDGQDDHERVEHRPEVDARLWLRIAVRGPRRPPPVGLEELPPPPVPVGRFALLAAVE